jgi:protein-S-isoprenylcysteine O-methyltransferase Ste14
VRCTRRLGANVIVVDHPSRTLILRACARTARLSLAVAVAATGAPLARGIAENRLLRERYCEYPDYARDTKSLSPYVFYRFSSVPPGETPLFSVNYGTTLGG